MTKPFDPAEFRFSVSSLKSYRQCGWKFRYEKVLKLKPEKEASHHRWLGRVVHNAIYESIATFQTGGTVKTWEIDDQLPDVHKSVHMFNTMWNLTPSNDYEKFILSSEAGEKPKSFHKKNKVKSLAVDDPILLEANWKKEAEKMVKNGVEVVRNIGNIVKLEHELKFKVLGHDFLGFIDVLAKDEDDRLEFYDFKTSWDKPTSTKVEEDAQFILYSYALKTLFNLDYYPKGYLVHLRSGSLVPAEITESIVQAELKKFAKNIDWMKDEMFYQNKHDPLCPYCDFYDLCYPKKKENTE